MKKIINGKKYNTETANFLGTACSTLFPTDFGYWVEELYVKRTGEYFIYGNGGARTRYAVREGNCWSGGSNIIPITKEEAKEWAEKHLTVEEYEEIFGEVAE